MEKIVVENEKAGKRIDIFVSEKQKYQERQQKDGLNKKM